MTKIFLYITAIFLFASCSSKKETAAESTEAAAEDVVVMTDAQLKNAGIETGTVLPQAMNSTLKVNGMVDVPPQNIVSVSFPLGGYLRSTKLMPGMHVSRGEVIAVIEDQALIQLQQDYLVAVARLNFLQQEYERQKMLNENKVNADKVYQQAQADFTSQKVLVKGYSEKLQLIGINPARLTENTISRSVTVHSPINGFVSKVNVNIGMYVNPTDVMFKIVDTDHLHAEAQVFERDLTKLKVGQRVLINLTNETVPRIAKVYLIGKEISSERTVRVHCHLEKEDSNLIPGMYFSALIELGDTPLNTVPENAVVSFEGKNYLFMSSQKNTFKMVEIKTGLTESGYTEIMVPEGFDLASSIVTNGTYGLISKLKNAEE